VATGLAIFHSTALKQTIYHLHYNRKSLLFFHTVHV